ncbi:hypothetical protein [Clostridium celatum]|uniref:Uncharacterized protein n=1 Tax=Clostridium celatum DSM 1785 TaxID=545697 RepID=L1QLA9_9CLOT|nr:hypothetical protein [Clostridium celatum]EKY28763.1 hypothetical protein HMPREF0216_00611 [Clostridium celatum DSM 1785]MCE9655331.1 hypothetical protein [Clostridium celatum]MDY3361115.1 hypothetical protein [Clostridium celatum]
MKKVTILIFLISLLLLNDFISPLAFSASQYYPCSCGDSNDPACQLEHKRHNKDNNFWNDENISLLSNSQKEQLYKLQDKISNGNTLTNDEKSEMLSLKDYVIKIKLGDDDYIKFKELLEKRQSGIELSKSENKKLESYFKKIR